MKILIIGGTRGIGAQLVNLGLEENHQITLLARTPEKLGTLGSQVQVIKGDVLDAAVVNTAVEGQDAVCLTLGVPITFKSVDLFSRGTANVIAAMQHHNIRRLICITGIGAGDSKGHGGFLYDRIFKPLFLKTIYEDKDLQESYIQASGLEWVIFRPAGLTNGRRTGSYRILPDLHGITSTRISRADVADCILRELSEPRFTRQCPLITY